MESSSVSQRLVFKKLSSEVYLQKAIRNVTATLQIFSRGEVEWARELLFLRVRLLNISATLSNLQNMQIIYLVEK